MHKVKKWTPSTKIRTFVERPTFDHTLHTLVAQERAGSRDGARTGGGVKGAVAGGMTGSVGGEVSACESCTGACHQTCESFYFFDKHSDIFIGPTYTNTCSCTYILRY